MSSEGEPLGVTLNRERLNEATAPESHRVSGDFAVELRNEGAPVHVHLRFTGPLADVATVTTSNHYVDAGATTLVPVAVTSVDASVEGDLRVVTGHGAEGTTVTLTVDPPPKSVDVDESFASPPTARLADASPDESDDETAPSLLETATESLPDSGTLAVAAVAGAALLAAAIVAITLDGIAVTLGVVAVLVAVVVAMFLLLE